MVTQAGDKYVRIHPRNDGARAGDVDGVIVEFTSGEPGTVQRVSHDLGRIPYGAIPIEYPGDCLWARLNPSICPAWSSKFVFFLPLCVARLKFKFLLF